MEISKRNHTTHYIPFFLLLFDIFLWLLIPSIFLLLAVNLHDLPKTAVLPHLKIFFTFFIALIYIKWLFFKVAKKKRTQDLLSALLTFLSLTAVSTFYLVVFVALSSWGRLPSFDLLLPYLIDLNNLSKTLDISLTKVFSVILAWTAIGWCLIHWRISQHHSALILYSLSSRTVYMTFSVLCIISVASTVTELHHAKWASDSEPLSAAIHPDRWNLQNNPINEATATILDEQAETERNNYISVEKPPPTNVFLIVVDALRPDHMGVYGYHRQTTPFLSRMMNSGHAKIARYVHASCAESSCGLLSLISSKSPHEFSRSPITLHEILHRNGYEVRLILSGDHTNFYGLRDIYGEVDFYTDGTSSGELGVNDDRLPIEKIEQIDQWNENPVIIQFHLMSAHTLGERWTEPKFTPERNYAFFSSSTNQPNSNLRQQAINYYDNGVLQVDKAIELLTEELREKNYLSNALIIITADHGELLGENGQYGHAEGVSEAALRIPFITLRFGNDSSRSQRNEFIGRVHSQADIAPTITQVLEIPSPSTWNGRPMQSSSDRCITFFRQDTTAGIYIDENSYPVVKYWRDRESEEESVMIGGDLISFSEEEGFAALEGSGHHLAPSRLIELGRQYTGAMGTYRPETPGSLGSDYECR